MDLDSNKLDIIEPEARLIRRAFKMRAAGATPYAIGKAVDKPDRTVRNWLHQAYYRGEPWTINLAAQSGGDTKRFDYPCPAIVDSDLWIAAQQTPNRATGRTRAYGLLRRVLHEHPDGTLVDCIGQTHDHDQRRYRCKASKVAHGEPGCPGMGRLPGGRAQTSINSDLVERAVIRWVVDLLTNKDEYAAAIQAAN